MSNRDDRDDRDGIPGDRKRALRERLGASSVPVPTSALGRLRLSAAAALRAAGSAFGRGGLDGMQPEAIEKLVASLGELKGLAMKIGQILSYVDDTLPPETRRLLSLLQVWSQPTPWEQVRAIVEEDLGPAAQPLLDGMDPRPVAAASIGQVHRARVGDALLAVKVRHPGIDAAIRADFRTARPGVALARLLLPGGDVETMVAEARERFLEECDYVQEARNQSLFADLYRGDPDLSVPAVQPRWCGARVLTSDWHDGDDFEHFLERDPPQSERDRVGAALYRFYVGTLYRHAVFNADPHPGNLVLGPGGRVTVVDYGCVRRFDATTVQQLAALSTAVRGGGEREMRSALAALGARDPGPGRFTPTADLLRAFYAPVLRSGAHVVDAGVTLEARSVIANKRAIARLHLPGQMLFLFRIRFGLHAVLARLRACVDWGALESALLVP